MESTASVKDSATRYASKKRSRDSKVSKRASIVEEKPESKFMKMKHTVTSYIMNFLKAREIFSLYKVNKRFMKIVKENKEKFYLTISVPNFTSEFRKEWERMCSDKVDVSKQKEIATKSDCGKIFKGVACLNEGLSYEFGIKCEKDLEKSLRCYKEGAKVNEIYCLLRLIIIFMKEFEMFKVEQNRKLAFFYLIKLSCYKHLYNLGFQDCLFSDESASYLDNVLINTRPFVVKSLIEYFIINEKDQKELKNLFFSLYSNKKEKYYQKIINCLKEKFDLNYFLFYYCKSYRNNWRENSKASFDVLTLQIRHLDSICDHLKIFSDFFPFMDYNLLALNTFTSLNVSLYYLFKLKKNFKQNVEEKFSKLYTTSNNLLIYSEERMKSENYDSKNLIIYFQVMYKEKQYDRLLEMLEFLRKNKMRYYYSHPETCYLFIKTLLKKKDEAGAKALYQENLSNLERIIKHYKECKLFYICYKITRLLLVFINMDLKEMLIPSILESNSNISSENQYYSFKCLKILKKETFMKLRKMRKEEIDPEKDKTEIKRILNFNDILSYKIYQSTVYLANLGIDEHIMKVDYYVKSVDKEDITLTLYLKKEGYYHTLESSRVENTEMNVKKLSTLARFMTTINRKSFGFNVITPQSVYFGKNNKMWIDPYLPTISMLRNNLVSEETKNNLIRYFKPSQVLYDDNQIANNCYNLAMIIFEIIYNKKPWADFKYDDLIRMFINNENFFDFHILEGLLPASDKYVKIVCSYLMDLKIGMSTTMLKNMLAYLKEVK